MTDDEEAETGPCGHDLGKYDIIAFGGPGGVVECMVCGHRVASPPSDAVDHLRDPPEEGEGETE